MKANILRRAVDVLSILVLFAAFFVSTSHAEPRGTVTFQVPFSFVVAGKQLPAGEYVVAQSTLNSNDILSIRRVDGNEGVYVLTRAVQANDIQPDAKLVFNRYADQYFLSEFWTSGEDSGRKVIKSGAEQTLARDAGKDKAERVAVLSRQK